MWDQEIRAVNLHARDIPNSGGVALSSPDIKIVGERADILFADRQACSGMTPPWSKSTHAGPRRTSRKSTCAHSARAACPFFPLGPGPRLLGGALRGSWPAAAQHCAVVTDEEPPVQVTGPGVLDVTAWQQQSSLTVFLASLTDPMMMKGPIHELLPVGEQQVHLRLPQGRGIARVHLRRLDQAPQVDKRDGYLTAVVPSVLYHEVIAIELSTP